MTIDLGPCSFHKERPAITGCTSCHRLLCSEDRKSIPTYRNRVQDYCPICYASVLKTKPFGFIFSIIVSFILFPLVIFTTQDVISQEFYILFFFGTVLVLLRLAYMSISNNSRAQKEAKYFMNSLPTKLTLLKSTKGTQEPPKFNNETEFTIKDSKHLVCFQCGTDLLMTDKFCPICGDSTKDELQALENRTQ